MSAGHLDKFARTKICSFCKRHGVEPNFELSQTGPAHSPVFTVRIKLPLPAQYGEQYGVGSASKKKDAETLAAMNAEVILAQLGYPLHSDKASGVPTSHPTSHPPSHPPSHPASYPPSHPTSHPPSHPPSHPASYPPSHPSSHPPSHLSSHSTSHPSHPPQPSSHPPSHPPLLPSHPPLLPSHPNSMSAADFKVPPPSPQNLDDPDFQNAVLQAAHAYAQSIPLDHLAVTKYASYMIKHGMGKEQIDTVKESGPKQHPLFTLDLQVPVSGSTLQWWARGTASRKKDCQLRTAMAFFFVLERVGQYDSSARIVNLPSAPKPPKSAPQAPQNVPQETYVAPMLTVNTTGLSFEQSKKLVDMYVMCLGLPQLSIQFQQRGAGHLPIFTCTLSSFRRDLQTPFVAQGEGPNKKQSESNAYVAMAGHVAEEMGSHYGTVREILLSQPELQPENTLSLSVPIDLERRLEEIMHHFADLEQQGLYTHSNIMDRRGNSLLSGSVKPSEPDAAQSAAEAKTSEKMREEQERYVTSPQCSPMMAHREGLPIAAHKGTILETIATNPVTIISGETGSGKSTQVPQFILEDMVARGSGAKCNIIITQPRRISAISLARRVAQERGESVGQSVGYQVRLEAVRGSSVLFCTAGVLLRLLNNASTLSGVSHLILDEVHERAIESDFLLILVRELVKRRPELRVLVMSATLETEAFSRYFRGAPVLSVAGRTYPVTEIYLPDIRELENKHQWPSLTAPSFGFHPLKPPAPRFKKGVPDSNDDDEEEFQDEVDYNLLASLVCHIVKENPGGLAGSILVFLPGWKEITNAQQAIERCPWFPNSGSDRVELIPLHSSLTNQEQQSIFRRTSGTKIILSTNIAETGITIDDVKCVVDTGAVKEKTSFSFSVDHGRLTQLITTKISQANATQRKGRAGRTGPGVCYRLYTRSTFEGMAAFQTPEIKRTPLEEVVLQVVALNLGRPSEFLARALEPPPPIAVDVAVQKLVALRALAEVEDSSSSSYRSRVRDVHFELTPLGYRLSLLPVEPAVAKMVLLSAIFGALDPILTTAAAEEMDPFLSSASVRSQARNSKHRFSRMPFASSSSHHITRQHGQDSRSDHLAVVNAYIGWARAVGSSTQTEDLYCRTNTLSRSNLTMMSKIKSQLFTVLQNSGFVSSQQDSGSSSQCFIDKSEASCFANNEALVRGLLTSGLYPNVCQHRTGSGRLFAVRGDRNIFVHPSSSLRKDKEFDNPWFVFAEKVKTRQAGGLTYVRELTNLHPLALLLFTGGKMKIVPGFGLAIVDDWVPFRVAGDFKHFWEPLARMVDVVCQKKFQDPEDRSNNGLLLRLSPLIAQLFALPLNTHTSPLPPHGHQGSGSKRYPDSHSHSHSHSHPHSQSQYPPNNSISGGHYPPNDSISGSGHYPKSSYSNSGYSSTYSTSTGYVTSTLPPPPPPPPPPTHQSQPVFSDNEQYGHEHEDDHRTRRRREDPPSEYDPLYQLSSYHGTMPSSSPPHQPSSYYGPMPHLSPLPPQRSSYDTIPPPAHPSHYPASASPPPTAFHSQYQPPQAQQTQYPHEYFDPSLDPSPAMFPYPS